ncbi:hypothetical protein B0H14DRAFT_3137888 [Mycena olivaceomarginata]|nr:hypothetical protein B0H14DRAFT_3137888 [Mycena olivaceomarginata]
MTRNPARNATRLLSKHSRAVCRMRGKTKDKKAGHQLQTGHERGADRHPSSQCSRLPIASHSGLWTCKTQAGVCIPFGLSSLLNARVCAPSPPVSSRHHKTSPRPKKSKKVKKQPTRRKASSPPVQKAAKKRKKNTFMPPQLQSLQRTLHRARRSARCPRCSGSDSARGGGRGRSSLRCSSSSSYRSPRAAPGLRTGPHVLKQLGSLAVEREVEVRGCPPRSPSIHEAGLGGTARLPLAHLLRGVEADVKEEHLQRQGAAEEQRGHIREVQGMQPLQPPARHQPQYRGRQRRFESIPGGAGSGMSGASRRCTVRSRTCGECRRTGKGLEVGGAAGGDEGPAGEGAGEEGGGVEVDDTLWDALSASYNRGLVWDSSVKLTRLSRKAPEFYSSGDLWNPLGVQWIPMNVNYYLGKYVALALHLRRPLNRGDTVQAQSTLEREKKGNLSGSMSVDRAKAMKDKTHPSFTIQCSIDRERQAFEVLTILTEGEARSEQGEEGRGRRQNITTQDHVECTDLRSLNDLAILPRDRFF